MLTKLRLAPGSTTAACSKALGCGEALEGVTRDADEGADTDVVKRS
jgi:hypothetical protein